MSTRQNKGWLFLLPWEIENTGGVNRVVLELCKECSKEEIFHPFIFKPDWYSSDERIQEKDFYTQIGFSLRVVPLDSLRDLKGVISYLFHLPLEIYKIKQIINDYNLKVVNFHYVGGLAPLTFALIKVFSKVEFKLLLSFHGSDILALEKKSKFFKKTFRFILSKSNRAICCSKGLSLRLINLFPDFENKVSFVHNGVSELFLTENDSNTSTEELPEELSGKQFILSVGAFEKKKGHDLLIRAFSIIRNAGSDLSLVIVGRSAPELGHSKSLIQALNLTDFVYLYQDIPPERLKLFYNAAELFVSPSRYESFGLVMVEAGAMKLPVVATETMGAKEIIENGLSGLLVKKESPVSIANAILHLVDNPKYGRFLSNNLVDRVSTNFLWERAWKEYRRLTENESII